MILPDEHEDDLEPEVAEGAEIETEKYEQDDEDNAPETEVRNPSERAEEGRPQPDVDEEEAEDNSSDSI